MKTALKMASLIFMLIAITMVYAALAAPVDIKSTDVDCMDTECHGDNLKKIHHPSGYSCNYCHEHPHPGEVPDDCLDSGCHGGDNLKKAHHPLGYDCDYCHDPPSNR